MIYITSDVDWAPDEVISSLLSLLNNYQVKCTFFATHKSKVLDTQDKAAVEIGLHPNFNAIFQHKAINPEAIIKNLHRIYPEALGVRSHSTMQSTTLCSLFKKQGLIYDSNYMLPYNFKVRAFKLWNGMVRIPYNWEDDIHLASQHDIREGKIDFKQGSHHVLNIHPIHVYLNTYDLNDYEKAKKYLGEVSKLRKHINVRYYGIRNLFIDLLEDIKRHKRKTSLLKNVALKYTSL